MGNTMVLLVTVLALGVGLLAWMRLNPACPSCHGRRWERRLCYPLLLCRRCYQRVDRAGRKYN